MKNSYSYAVFDLDETLYSTETGLMQAIRWRILTYLQQHLNLSEEESLALQMSYHRRFGTTLQGLQAEHQEIEPNDFLAYVHNVPLSLYLRPDAELKAGLAALPLHRVVFTNSNIEHAERVLQALDIRDVFEDVIDIRRMGFRNKPYPEAYRTLLEAIKTPPEQCIMVEDALRNLVPARELGMTTIYISRQLSFEPHYTVASVNDSVRLIHELVVNHHEVTP
jgi:putative hydrolase of the HAD superfamily